MPRGMAGIVNNTIGSTINNKVGSTVGDTWSTYNIDGVTMWHHVDHPWVVTWLTVEPLSNELLIKELIGWYLFGGQPIDLKNRAIHQV